MRRSRLLTVVVALAVAALGARAATPPTPEAQAAFERLKSLVGDWDGAVTAMDGPPTTVRYELTAGGSVVMETLFGGTPHEMRSLYHMDNGVLVISHYCSMGNQPRMRLRSGGKADELVFDFDGGTNLDPAKDLHIHSGRIRFLDADHVEAEWDAYRGTEKQGSKRFFLARRR
jgi:hypothetical protein